MGKIQQNQKLYSLIIVVIFLKIKLETELTKKQKNN